MAISVASVLNSGDATDRTGPSNPYTTAAPATQGSSSDVHVLAIIGIMGSSVTPPAPSSVTQTGITWTKDTRVGGGSGVLGFKTSGANRFSVSFWYAGGPLPALTTISIDFGSNAMIGCAWQLLRISGGDVSAGVLAALVQIATNTNETLATTGTISATLSSPVTAASRSFYFVPYNTNDTNNTVESGHTQIARLPSQTSPAVGMVSGWHSTTFDTTPSVTNSTGSTNAYGIIAFEIPVASVSTAVGRASSTNSGRTITAGKSLEAGRSSETDTARSVSAGVGVVVGRAEESDSGRDLTAGKSKVVGRASSLLAARGVTRGKSLEVGRAGEVATARDLVSLTVSIEVGRAEEKNRARRLHEAHPYAPHPVNTSTRIPTPISFVLGKMDGGENPGLPLDELIEPQIVMFWGPFEGSLTFKYPVGGLNWDQLVAKQEIIVMVDGEERQDVCSRFYVQSVEFDALEKQPVETVAHPLRPSLTYTRRQAATITVKCSQLWNRWNEYTIQPLTGTIVHHDKIWDDGTPAGEVIRWLLTDAHEHNALNEISRDFDADHTSDDAPWDRLVGLTTPRGSTGLPIIQWLWDEHALDVRMSGRTIQATNWDVWPTNWANADGPKVLLISGRDFQDAPVEHNHTEQANFVTVYGDENRKEERWTGYPGPLPEQTWMVTKNASGVKDPAVLGDIADRWLEYYELGPRIERNFAVVLGWGHDPLVTYIPGDEILVIDGTGTGDVFEAKAERLRVMQLTMRKSQTGEWSADLVLQDRIAQRAERFQRQINGLIGGGPGTARPSRFAVPPAAPGGTVEPTVVTEIYTPEIGSGGKNYARATATSTWSGLDRDGVECGDFKRFWGRWQYGVDKKGWNEVPGGDNPVIPPEIVFDTLEPGKHIRIQLGVEDTSGNFSWDEPGDTTPTWEDDLPADNGEYRAFDADGQDIFRITDDGQWHATKVPGGALAATGAGVSINSETGYKVFGTGGDRLIYHDYASGDAEYVGNMHIGGNLLVDGITVLENDTTINDVTVINDSTTINGTLTVNADVTFHGDFTTDGNTILGGSLSLAGDLDANGHEIHGGSFNTDSGVVISGSTITMGSATISFSGSLIQTSGGFAAGGALSTSSTLTVSGFANLNGGGYLGAGSGDTAGMHGTGTTRQTVTGSRGGNAALADLLSKLDAKGVIFDGTSA